MPFDDNPRLAKHLLSIYYGQGTVLGFYKALQNLPFPSLHYQTSAPTTFLLPTTLLQLYWPPYFSNLPDTLPT